MKKIGLLFAMLLMIMAFAFSASAETEGYYTYEVENDEATITDVSDSYGLSGDVVIPDTLGGYPVTAIGDEAFRSCYNIKSITIPDSVTTIGEWAFLYCDSLTSVTIPDSVTTIGDYAFYNCYSLTSVTIPDSVMTIGVGAFYSCYDLTSVTIPDSVTTIGDDAFCNCDSLTSVTIPDSVTTIGEEAFECCFSLTNVTIPDSVTTIGEWAFAYCYSLTSVTIPDSVTTIGDRAFYYCTSLTSIVVDINNSAYSNDSRGVLFNKNKTMLIQYPTGNTDTSYTIPDSVTTIGDYAFYSCDSLTSVTIPDSVTSIGDEAFYRCTSLTDVYYNGTEEQWKKIIIGNRNEHLNKAIIHYNSTGPSDNPNSGDNLNKVTIEFTPDTYEVEVDDTVTVSATVTCPAGIKNSNLDMVWEVIDSDGTEIVFNGEYSRSETEWACYAEIKGLKEGTYFINLRDNTSTMFDTVKIIVNEYDEPYHPSTPSKPIIICNNTTVEYKQNVDFDKRKKFTINGEITNYNEEHTLTDISITIKSPDANKAVFKTENGYEASVTFPLGKTIEAGKARDFKCTAYIKRGYNPPNGAEDLTFTCILHGKLNGTEVNGIYKTFNVKIKNLSYENPDDNKNWTPTTMIGLLDILFTSKTPKGNLYIDCYPDKSAASTLKWQYKSIKATNAVISTIELSDALSERLDVAIELTELGNISAIKIQDEIFGMAEDALDEVMGAYQDIAMNEIEKFYDGEIKRLLESKEYKEYLKWYSREINHINGNSTKITQRCPIDIYVTDEEGYRILQITGSDIEVFDEYAAAYLSGDDKILYLPNDIGHSIKTVATDNGEMDYIIESYSKQGEYRIIEYDNIPLTKGKSYTSTVPLDMTSNTDMFNPKSEDGKVIKADKEETEHRYGEKDKNCQLCGFDRTEGCSCNCHKSGFMGFIWKIILFFNKLFKTNKTCVCGLAHY